MRNDVCVRDVVDVCSMEECIVCCIMVVHYYIQCLNTHTHTHSYSPPHTPDCMVALRATPVVRPAISDAANVPIPI